MNNERTSAKGNLVTTCVECGRRFAVKEEEIKLLKERGLKPPKRCKECLRSGCRVFTEDGLLNIFPEETEDEVI